MISSNSSFLEASPLQLSLVIILELKTAPSPDAFFAAASDFLKKGSRKMHSANQDNE